MKCLILTDLHLSFQMNNTIKNAFTERGYLIIHNEKHLFCDILRKSVFINKLNWI